MRLRDMPEADRAKARERITADIRARIGDVLTPEQKQQGVVLLDLGAGRAKRLTTTTLRRVPVASGSPGELVDAVEEVFRAGNHDTPPEAELALARGRPATAHVAQGLKEKTMVGAEGLEPPTPSL